MFLNSLFRGATAEGEHQRSEIQLRRSERDLADFFENGLVALQWVGPDGRILRANQAQLELAGYTREEYVGRHIAEFHPDPDALAELLSRLEKGETVRDHEVSLRCKDGSIKHVLLSTNVLWEDGRFIHTRSFMRDITQRKRLEAELRRQAQELAESHRRKDEFMAMLAHELRNPLAPVRNALHLLRQRGTDEVTRRWVQDVLGRQVEHMSRLLDDLLDVARIARGEIDLRRECVDLGLLMAATTEDQRALLETAGLSLLLEVPPEPVWVLADRTRLAQVLGNLLQNAAKFTDPGGRVTIRLEKDTDGKRAAVTVQDTGIGIQPELLDAVFQPFFQADRTLDRSRGGLGLGLALVKAVVQLHGGTVRALSAGPGRGSEITFWLPLEREAAAQTPLPAPAHGPGKSLRVVIVEDNPDTGETLRALLELFGHEARIAHSGRAGVEAARQWQPDVVLCDIGLPGMDGYAVARILRQDPAIPKTNLIALTGYSSDADKNRCLEAGFRLHLTKPIDPAELQRILDSVARTR
ncbi:MAG TPA: ATP-binding protein [Gemmataceae bacterium]|nr:ATP-binding protein [Gemmataceae bacterium]